MPPFDRTDALARLETEQFDVLVVGGGVTGCGVALDAAARGLRTALVESRDFGSGTSSKSSKLVHGGLRYLQQRDYRLVYEALAERQRLIRNAPHLVHPLPFLIPLFGRGGVVSKSVAKTYSAALWTYDITGGIRIGHRHRRVDASEAIAHFPALRTDRLVASFLYWDAQADDARLTLALARTAADHGAVLVNYAPVAELIEERGTVRGARLTTGGDVRATVVVNAGGIWAERVARLAPGHGETPVAIRPAKGVHIAVPSTRLPCDFASVLAVPGERRTVFVVPWAADEATGPDGPGRYTYVGTTDTDYNGPLDEPHCTPEDTEYLLRAVNAWTSANLTPDDITGTWAGLRPLISDARTARTADLSRRHKVVESANGLITVTGGKLTTYRRMAADTVDVVAKRFGGTRRISRSPTRNLRLAGAPETTELPAELDGKGLRHLWGRYGSATPTVVDIAREDPRLGDPLVSGLPYLRAEAVYAARHEMAWTLSDVLARRTRALILDREAAVAAAPAVAKLVGAELGWDDGERARQVADLATEADADRRAAARAAAS